jgi:hypothetical protein
MNINTNSIVTAGAFAFAGFAVWYITRKPQGELAKQPAQADRDAGLQQWNDGLQKQYETLGDPYKFNPSKFQDMLDNH